MPRYRASLPMLDGGPFLTDGGIETTLIYHHGLELPCFAAFPLLDSEAGRDALDRYFQPYVDLARRRGIGLILESPTWRASADWGTRLGYTPARLRDIQRRALAFLERYREQMDGPGLPVVLSGNLGPRGDGYVASAMMSADEAAGYHRAQVEAFVDTEADLVTALTLNYVAEAIGIALAARAAGMPVVLGFTVETDGRLPTGESLQDAIQGTDEATGGYPAYYMVNCAHPTHIAVGDGSPNGWRDRVRGVRANASAKSHAELNEATELDAGNPAEFGSCHLELMRQFRRLRIVGGCCGTDHRHVEAASGVVHGQAPAGARDAAERHTSPNPAPGHPRSGR